MTAVLFDLDDTLFDHHRSTCVALAEMRLKHTALVTWSVDELNGHHAALLERLHLDVLAGRLSVDGARQQRFATLFEMAGAPLTQDEVAVVAGEYRDAYTSSWQLVPGAVEVLDALRGRARIGIVTNNVVGEQTRKMRRLGLEPLVDAAVISEAVGVSKPHPRIFAMALERLDCPASEAVMVGDAWRTDIIGALRAGMRAVWFNPTKRPRPDATVDVAELSSFEPVADAVSVILGPGARSPQP